MDAMHRRVASLFPGRRGTRTTKVGLEHELLAADAHTGAAVPLERLRAVVEHSTYGATVSFEPGGQLELSLPPASSPFGLMQRFVTTLATVEGDCAAAGVTLAAVPVDPRGPDEVPLQLTSPRYVAMQAHFDRIGPAGRRMMRRTASTQVCLDWWPGEAGLEQWRLLNLAAPFLAAAFDRSDGTRLAIWLAVDPGRTAFDGRLLAGDDPVAAYADLARGSTDFLGSGIDAHLTTLFPPVRPRGSYLEVRFPDVQDQQGMTALLRVLATLTYCDGLRGHLLKQLGRERECLGDRWWAAAMGDPNAIDRGVDIMGLAERSARLAPTGYLPAPVEFRPAARVVDALGGVA